MKNLLFILTMFLSLTTIGQIEIYNLSLTDSTKNIVYEGQKNIIKIKGVTDQQSVELLANERIYKVDSTRNDLYYFYPYIYNSVTLKVLVNNCVAFSKQFDCLTFPEFKPIFGKTNDTILSKNEILLYPYLSLTLSGCIYKYNYDVVEYSLCFLIKNINKLPKEVGDYRLIQKKDNEVNKVYLIPKNESIYLKCIGCDEHKIFNTRINDNILPKEHIDIINLMQSGDKIYFDSIISRSSNGSNFNIGTLTITIM